MLDPDEVAAYEVWKEAKLIGSTDLSVNAYNAEMEVAALAYEAGVKAAFGRGTGETQTEILAANPYRKSGMRGHTP